MPDLERVVDEIEEADLERLIPAFYDRVRSDDMIGALFNDAIDDWPDHLQRLIAFWSAVMRSSGRYKGSPVAAHLRHRASIRPEMFERWLALWTETTDQMMPPAAAAALQAKARRIAESLSLALFFRVDRKAAAG